MTPRLIVLVTMLGSLAACASGTTLTQTEPHYPPRDPRCEFLAFAAKPTRGYTEIGTIDVEPKSFKPYVHIADFNAEIRPYVCQAGGDAVIAYVNVKGWYIKAVVLKRVDVVPVDPAPAPRSAATATATALPASASPAAPPPTAGCQYDTQCKGDRICTNGACVDPPPAAAAPASN